MQNLIKYLADFNSKERFFLTGNILGNPKFSVALSFREKLNDKINITVPEDAFSAMDYHLDWIYAALNLATNGDGNKIYPNNDGVIKAQIEDIDWLIAFEDQDVFHIVLIEAKGVGGWTKKQLQSKADRFEQIFGKDGDKWTGVKPHFVLMSPRRQSFGLYKSGWPVWMAPEGDVKWIELPVPSNLICVTRCTVQGEKSENGDYWKIKSRNNHSKNSGKKSVNSNQNKVQGLAGVKTLLGESVYIGYTGGINALINADLGYLKNRPYKWVDKVGSRKIRRNWIPINEFVKEIRRMGFDL